MNEHIITINVMKNIIFSKLSTLCAKWPLLVNNVRTNKINPKIGIGAKTMEWRIVASKPITIIPNATNEVKYTMTFSESILFPTLNQYH